MNTKKYTPNFNHRSVKNRVRTALGFTLGFLREDADNELSQTLIIKHFGQNHKKLSQYLRRKLLHCTDHHFSKADGKTKKYTFNRCGVEYIKYMMDYPNSNTEWNTWQDAWYMWLDAKNHPKVESNNIDDYFDDDLVINLKNTIDTNDKDLPMYDRRWVSRFLDQEYSKQFLTGKFDYAFKSNRLWNPLQSIKKLYKKPFFAHHDYQHIYDIEACAPTLLLQYARKSGFDKPTPAYDRYLGNKEEVRIMIADLIESDIAKVKVFINSLFNGSKIGTNERYAISQLFDNDKAIMMVLQQDVYINQLRTDIKNLWKSLEHEFPIRYKESVGKTTGEIKNRKLPLSSLDKWNVYFKLEFEITTHIRNYLDMNNIKYFFEHDGWCSCDKVDTDELRKFVIDKSGYDLYFSYEFIDKSDHESFINDVIGVDDESGSIGNKSDNSNGNDRNGFNKDNYNDKQPKGLSDNGKNNNYNSLESQPPSYTLVDTLEEKCNENVATKVPMTSTERSRLCRARKKALQNDKNIT